MPNTTRPSTGGPTIQFRAAKSATSLASAQQQPAVRILNRHSGASSRPSSGLSDGVNVRTLPASNNASPRVSTISPLASVPSRPAGAREAPLVPNGRRASAEEVERREGGYSPRQDNFRQPALNAGGMAGVSGAKSQPELRTSGKPRQTSHWAETDLDNGNFIRYERTLKPRGPPPPAAAQQPGAFCLAFLKLRRSQRQLIYTSIFLSHCF